MARIRVWRCVTLVTLTLAVAAGYAQEHASLSSLSVPELDKNAWWDDRICGPRCVQYLLGYYDLESEDIIDLVREVQWPDLERGASLDRVEQSLRDRGIHTASIVVPENGELCWHSPAVVHLKDDEAGLGHFAVWLPESSGGEVKVWGGRSGTRVLEKRDFSKLFTGVALLTSREPLGDPGSAIVNPIHSIRGIRFLLGATVVGGAILVFVAFRMRGQPFASRLLQCRRLVMRLVRTPFMWIGSALVMVGAVGLALTTTQSSRSAQLDVDTSLVWGGDSCWEEAEWGGFCELDATTCGDYWCSNPTVCPNDRARESNSTPYYTECMEDVSGESGWEACPTFLLKCGKNYRCGPGCTGPDSGGDYYCELDSWFWYEQLAVREDGRSCPL